MKTNIGLVTSDEERLLIGEALGTGKMITRKELTAEVERHVRSLIAGEAPVGHANEEVERPPQEEPQAERDRSVRGFVPSRGDEPYLYKPKDPELAAVCSSLLDGLEFVEEYVWNALERNRSTS